MATIGEIRKAIEGLPDDTLFGTLDIGGFISFPATRDKTIVLTKNDDGKDVQIAVVLEQDKHDWSYEPTEEQADLLYPEAG